MPFGPLELGIILVIILLIFGAGKLPQVFGQLGKGIKEFRDASSETRSEAEIAAEAKATSEAQALTPPTDRPMQQ